MLNRSHRAWIDVDLGALRRNAEAIARHSRARLLPMIKADAYGLGATAVLDALEPLEPWGYGIATVSEGEELRACGVRRPLVVFTPLLSDEYDAARAAQLTPTLGSAESIRTWCRKGGTWHLSIDTGMSRAGIQWREADSLRDVLKQHAPQGAFTHFHSPELNDPTMSEQERRFTSAIGKLPKRPEVLHAEGSAAIARHHRSRWDVVRPGIFLYGVGSGEGALLEPHPVVTLRTRIVELRWVEPGDTVSYEATYCASSRRRIATLPMGYADGYPRSLSNAGEAIVRGEMTQVVGRVTMDMTMIDVTDVRCEVGDIVTLIGADGDRQLTVAAVAQRAGVSHYELLTRLRGRLDRFYVTEWHGAR